jgi:hypothetical protein
LTSNCSYTFRSNSLKQKQHDLSCISIINTVVVHALCSLIISIFHMVNFWHFFTKKAIFFLKDKVSKIHPVKCLWVRYASSLYWLFSYSRYFQGEVQFFHPKNFFEENMSWNVKAAKLSALSGCIWYKFYGDNTLTHQSF